MDLDIHTRRPERERDCRACQWDDPLSVDGPPEHSCRTPPATPRAVLQERARAAGDVIRDRELEIRRQRLADIHAGLV
jgi:hypothetical protein